MKDDLKKVYDNVDVINARRSEIFLFIDRVDLIESYIFRIENDKALSKDEDRHAAIYDRLKYDLDVLKSDLEKRLSEMDKLKDKLLS
jgi:flagellar motility protein MotE (MotC chaperone)